MATKEIPICFKDVEVFIFLIEKYSQKLVGCHFYWFILSMIDVDECKSGRPNVCEANMVCQNSIGGYHCVPHEKSKVSVIILGMPF